MSKLNSTISWKAIIMSLMLILIQTHCLFASVILSKKPCIIKFEIEAPDFSSITINAYTYVPSKTKEIQINRDTVFYDTIVSNRPVYLKIKAGEEIAVYTEPGSRIRILIRPGSQLSTRVQFGGDLSDFNKYLLQINDLKSKAGDVLGMMELPVETYVVKVDSFQLIKSDLLANCRKKNPSHPFWLQQKTLIGLEAPLAKYEFAFLFFVNHIAPMPLEWRDKLMLERGYLVKYPEILSIPIMQSYLDDYIASHSSRLYNRWVAANQSLLNQEGFTKPNSFEFGVRYVIDSVDNQEMKNFLLLKLVQRGLDAGELKPIKTVLALFYDHCTDNEMIDFVKTTESYYQGIQPGQTGPDISGYDQGGKKISLQSLKGKFILVDVWATWCGPCIGDFPNFNKLAAAYKGRNIVFVKYSVDENREQWLDFLSKDESPETGCMDLISENGTECRLMKDYRFDAIPRYLLFDAKGRIISIRLERPGALLRSKLLDNILDNSEYQ